MVSPFGSFHSRLIAWVGRAGGTISRTPGLVHSEEPIYTAINRVAKQFRGENINQGTLFQYETSIAPSKETV